MDWVHDFYQAQNELTGVYTGDIQDHHRHKVDLITKHHPTAKTVLELGAGGGQVACATALAGYTVTAIELVPSLAKHVATLASKHNVENLTVLNADFYKVELDKQFDVVMYWDGFGIGTDKEQRRLLKRCQSWLNPDGIMLIDVMTPWYWANASGQTMTFGDVGRRYDFDADNCRLLDTWWHTDTPDQTITQFLRCYSPADLRLLLQGTGLQMVDVVETGGTVDYATGDYQPNVELHRAMSYVAKLHSDGSPIHEVL